MEGNMIDWWWVIPAFIIGEMIGILAIGIVSGRGGDR